MSDLIEHMRDYLIAQNIVRKPSVADTEPPMWLHPRDGVPAPGEGQNATERDADRVTAAFFTGGIPTQSYESFRRLDTVDIWLRVSKAPYAQALYRSLRAALIDKRNWTMGAITVIESKDWRPLQPLGSDEQGFVFNFSVLFEHYADDGA